ncbi:MAG: hypothetical protein IVW36_06280 [Dehalococcoidia bacterium]|nr:hypothetical protein [Dehalococcoidia bacterium]
MASEGASVPDTCLVCGEAAPDGASARCNWCDGRFHLNQRNDVAGKDCGQVWIDEQYMALRFACNACLSRDGMPAAAPSGADGLREVRPHRASHRPASRRHYRRRA